MVDRKGYTWNHQTLRDYPDQIVGITLVDEKPGYTGIYVRDPQGGLFPARTVVRRPASHHKSVIEAWLSREGEHVDLRKKVGKKAAKKPSKRKTRGSR